MAPPKVKMPVGIATNTDCTWCLTSLQETKFSFLWTIKKFSCLQKATGESIESATFSSRDDDRNKFCMRLFPKGDKYENKDDLSLFMLQLLGDFQVLVDFDVFIVNNKKERCLQHSIKSHKFEKKGRPCGWPTFTFLNNLQGFLPNDEITIFCEVVVRGGHTNKSGHFYPNSDKDSISHQAEDLGHLFATRKFSDVVLVARDGEVHAHKAILTLKSPVFAAMFEHDMVESQKNRIEISDIAHTVLQEMIRFIYTGKAPVMDDELATRLLAAAEKYALEGLKECCEERLSMNLTPEKVINLIPLASMYSANNLIANLSAFLKLHVTDDASGHLWDNLIRNLPNQAVLCLMEDHCLQAHGILT